MKLSELRNVLPATADLTGVLAAHLSNVDLPPCEIVDRKGTVHRYGTDEPRFRVLIKSKRGTRAVASMDEQTIAVAYMRGDLDVEGDFHELLQLRNVLSDRHPLQSVWRFVRPRLRGQDRNDNERTADHYDYGDDLYLAFLDKRHRLYSQAVFANDVESLEEAAARKLDYVWQSCELSDGSRVLDVGAGWGSFSELAAGRGADVTMLTLSSNQYEYLQALAGSSDYLPGSLQVHKRNLFDQSERQPFDAVVLLGVMEHLVDYPRALEKFARLVRPGGFVYADFASTRAKFDIASFAHQYIFKGNHSPVDLGELLTAVQDTPFEVKAVHNDRYSYQKTLWAWAERLEAAEDEIVGKLGIWPYRLFRMYLWAVGDLMADGSLSSHRIVLQRSADMPASTVGLHQAVGSEQAGGSEPAI